MPCIKSFIPYTESCTMPSAHEQASGSLYDVMKQLIAIRNRARR